MKKGFATVLIIILVIALAILATFAFWQFKLKTQPANYQTSNIDKNVSNEKTYKNNYLGISLTLPDHVKYNSILGTSQHPLFLDDRLPTYGKIDNIPQESEIMSIVFTINNICKNQIIGTPLKSKTISVGGKQADYIEFNFYLGNYHTLAVCFPQGDKFFYIAASEPPTYTSSQKGIVSQDFQQILSSIKLAQPAPPADISNWKTYNNNLFSIKYPPDWAIKTFSTSGFSLIPPVFYPTEFAFDIHKL